MLADPWLVGILHEVTGGALSHCHHLLFGHQWNAFEPIAHAANIVRRQQACHLLGSLLLVVLELVCLRWRSDGWFLPIECNCRKVSLGAGLGIEFRRFDTRKALRVSELLRARAGRISQVHKGRARDFDVTGSWRLGDPDAVSEARLLAGEVRDSIAFLVEDGSVLVAEALIIVVELRMPKGLALFPAKAGEVNEDC